MTIGDDQEMAIVIRVEIQYDEMMQRAKEEKIFGVSASRRPTNPAKETTSAPLFSLDIETAPWGPDLIHPSIVLGNYF